MFRCSHCSQSADRPNRIVTKRKMVQHTPQTVGPRGGYGSQIVEEKNVCSSCLANVPEAPIERNDLSTQVAAAVGIIFNKEASS